MSSRPRSVLVASPSRLFGEATATYIDALDGWASAGTVTDGLEAVAAVARLEPDAVLVTPGLPRMGPAALAQQVRRRWPGVAVVVLGEIGPDGRGLPPDAEAEAVIAALASPPSGAPVEVETDRPNGLALLANLTRRERAVMKMLAEGRSQSEMAAALKVSDHTIRTHMQNLYAKLGCHSRLDVVRFAMRHGLIAGEPPSGAG